MSVTGPCDQYSRQIAAQIAQYAGVDDMHAGAPAFHWMNERFLAPRLRDVFGSADVTQILATSLSDAVQRCGLTEVVSLGSGYGINELKILHRVREIGLAPFRIICLELSPLLAERTREAARAAGLDDLIRIEVTDINQPIALNRPVAAFMAHHSLHHLVELELLFDEVIRWLHPEGVFSTVDMIGRNGHMRWPEALSVIRQIWPCLPDRLKWDRIFQRLDRWYENWDCSIEGFEGIRAQDILPLLISKGFRFERFVAIGGLADVFYDRRFGYNFDLDNPGDVAFLEQIQAIEDRLLASGRIKPVCLYAVMRSPLAKCSPFLPVCAGGLTPDQAQRPLDKLMSDPLDAGFVSPYPAQPVPSFYRLECDGPISFGRQGQGPALLRWGWGQPEDDFTWSMGIDSALAFSVAREVSRFELRFIPYRPPGGAACWLTLKLNGVQQGWIDLSAQQAECYSLGLQQPLPADSPVILEIALSRPRRPDIDGGDDRRPLGIALVSITAR